MLKQLLNGRFLGHPIHPMLVHFPTVLFPVSFLFDLAGIWTSGESFFAASFYCVGAGLGGGFMAALFGLIDYIKLTDREPLFRKASWHALLQFLVLMIFGIVFGLRYEGISAPGLVELLVSGLGICLMLTGNYLGGDLVFRDGVGVYSEKR